LFSIITDSLCQKCRYYICCCFFWSKMRVLCRYIDLNTRKWDNPHLCGYCVNTAYSIDHFEDQLFCCLQWIRLLANCSHLVDRFDDRQVQLFQPLIHLCAACRHCSHPDLTLSTLCNDTHCCNTEINLKCHLIDTVGILCETGSEIP
jgi:hypothetical protein